jgi:hypothetical protein
MAKQAIHLPAGSSEIHPTHEDIAAVAYAHWQEKGCPEGACEEHWLRAEQELTANREVAVQAPRGATSPESATPLGYRR